MKNLIKTPAVFTLSTTTKDAIGNWYKKVNGLQSALKTVIDGLRADGLKYYMFSDKQYAEQVDAIKRTLLESAYTKAELAWIDDKKVKQTDTYPRGKNAGRTKKSMRDGHVSGFMAELKRQIAAAELAESNAKKASGGTTADNAGQSGSKPEKRTKRTAEQVKLERLVEVLNWMQNLESPAFEVNEAIKDLKSCIKHIKTKKEVK